MNLYMNEIIRYFNLGDEIEKDLNINNVVVDSREVSIGDIFICLKRENCDGHDFVSEALDKGALCAIVERDVGINDKIFKVESTLNFLQNLAKFYLEKFDIKKIGITGSVGKSTVKEMVSSIFETEFNVLKTGVNFNGQVGVPLTCFGANKDTQVSIFEMGISEIGNMEKLVNIVHPDFAVINNIGVSHIGNFGNLETTCEEKFKISSDDCVVCLNADSLELSNFSPKHAKKIIRFGLNGDFDYKAEGVSSLNNETEFVLVTEFCRESIKIPCLGIHNVYNALGAISVSMEFGIHLDDIKQGLLNFKSLPMRQKIINFKDFILIDDSYNASPDSVKASINLLQSIKSKGRNIVVIADILELGNYSREIHFDLGRYMSFCNIDIVISIGNCAKYICDAIKLSKSNIETFSFNSNDETYTKILQILQNNDKILIKGSRGMKTDEIVSMLIDKFGEVVEKT